MSEETKKPSRRLMEKLLEERIFLLSEPVMPESRLLMQPRQSGQKPVL